MSYDGKIRCIGSFKTEPEAILARDAALKVFKNLPSVVGSDNIDSIVEQAKKTTTKKKTTKIAAKKSPFEKRMDDLREYKEKHGHINVKKSDDKSLYKFCINIRYVRSHPEKSDRAFTDDRIASLDALGFDWR